MEFGEGTEVERRLPPCGGLGLRTSFSSKNPFDESTGWWTLLNVDTGCWEIQVNNKWYTSTKEEVSVPTGRPTIANPLVVTRKPGIIKTLLKSFLDLM